MSVGTICNFITEKPAKKNAFSMAITTARLT